MAGILPDGADAERRAMTRAPFGVGAVGKNASHDMNAWAAKRSRVGERSPHARGEFMLASRQRREAALARGIGAGRCVDEHLHQVVRFKPGRDLFCRKLVAEGELDRPKSIARRGGETIEERYLRIQKRKIRRKARHDGLYPTMTSDVAVGEPHVQRLLQTARSLKPSFHHVQQALPSSMRLRGSEPVQWPCDHEQGEPVHG